MEILLTRDVGEFAALADEFLAARVEHNVLATLSEMMLTAGPLPGWGEPCYGLGLDSETGEVVAAALRTPPRHLIASGFRDPGVANELIEAWLAVDPDVTGVSAAPDEASVLCAAWSGLTGARTELQISEALHQLDAVIAPPQSPPGALRLADQDDFELVSVWMREFSAETGFGDPSAAAMSARRVLADRRTYLWDDDGPATLIGHATRVAGVNRVGPVYTPPTKRGRGYASVAVAALSQQLLEAGASRCILLTDLANPTANKIYAAVGYQRFGEWEEHRFLPDSGASGTAH